MSDISLVCMREDAYRADQLAGALERYGFSVCRSASVFEDFQGYAAVIVLLSPGAARSDLVMGTAERAMDFGKLIPVFVNLCRLPDRLAGVPLHDLSAWDGEDDDRVVQAIAFHAHRLAGLPGRPDMGPPSTRYMALEAPVRQQSRIGYQPSPSWEPGYDHEQTSYGAPYAAPYVATAFNQIEGPDRYDYGRGSSGSFMNAVDDNVFVSPNDVGQYRSAPSERQHFQPAQSFHYSYDDEPETPPRRRRPLPSIMTMVVCAVALMGTAWFEEARTREVAQLSPTPAEATADLSSPSVADPGDTPRKRVEVRR